MVRNKMIFNGQSIVLTWLTSYIVVLLLPIAIGFLLYFESSRTLKEEIHQANDSLLKQIREIMDNQFKMMEQLNFEMTWGVRMQELLYSNKYEAFPKEYVYDVYQIAQDLKLFKNSYPLIDSFYVYFNANDSVILPGTVRTGTFAYETLHQSDAFSFVSWSSIIGRSNFKGFIPMYRINDDNKSQKTVAYISTYPLERDKPVATNVLMIDESRILGVIQNMEIFNKGHVLILNENNQILAASSDLALPDDFPYGQLQDDANLYYSDPNGEKYEVSYIQSPRSKLKYVSMIPSSHYWKKAEHVRKLTYVSMAVSLLGGCILTMFFLRRNYHPVRRLVEAFSKKTAFPARKRYNEFHFIQEAVDSTLSEVDNMKLKMEQQRHIIRSNFIVKLLRGKLDSQVPIDEALTTFHMRFDTNDYAVMLFVVEDSRNFFERIEGMQEGDKWRLMHFIIMNVVEELVSRKYRGYAAEIDDTIACLVNVRQEAGHDAKSELLWIAQEALSFLAATYEIRLTISISRIHEQISRVSTAFIEALDTMEYKLVMGRQEILAFDDLQTEQACDTDNGYYYPLQLEQQLMSAVKLGELENAKSILVDIMANNLERPGISAAMAKCLMLDLVSTMMKTVSEAGDMQESFFIRNPKLLDRLIVSKTIQDMQQQLHEILHHVCEYTWARRQQNMDQSRQRALQKLVEEVTAYIENNYNNPNLNVTMIGNHFDRKATYLSKLFKDYAGEGLLDTINKVRIEKSKQLMMQRDQSVGDAASCVGFNDINAFIRVFKKMEGITPGRYKELAQK
ncbi:AraC family transcriptional regulator [Paenibacillus sedimenti]|uniref:Helix-turn-helix domain-containing protein n=1 Tax=Paenibacillus sedimenti TaxID=2770274 RepID=A0A926KR52_9BACL|nr:helix-turn-helix domain-containing protein [Paenibacillus sedimenti]MBD0381396.1 helix-turn-helix domain-containing protein [Paenibacillus sedimenti]